MCLADTHSPHSTPRTLHTHTHTLPRPSTHLRERAGDVSRDAYDPVRDSSGDAGADRRRGGMGVGTLRT